MHRVALFCDDFLCRGSREVSEEFYRALSARFDCKEPEFLELGDKLVFTVSLSVCTPKYERSYASGGQIPP